MRRLLLSVSPRSLTSRLVGWLWCELSKARMARQSGIENRAGPRSGLVKKGKRRNGKKDRRSADTRGVPL